MRASSVVVSGGLLLAVMGCNLNPGTILGKSTADYRRSYGKIYCEDKVVARANYTGGNYCLGVGGQLSERLLSAESYSNGNKEGYKITLINFTDGSKPRLSSVRVIQTGSFSSSQTRVLDCVEVTANRDTRSNTVYTCTMDQTFDKYVLDSFNLEHSCEFGGSTYTSTAYYGTITVGEAIEENKTTLDTCNENTPWPHSRVYWELKGEYSYKEVPILN